MGAVRLHRHPLLANAGSWKKAQIDKAAFLEFLSIERLFRTTTSWGWMLPDKLVKDTWLCLWTWLGFQAGL
jgi:hypothetical protein